MGSRLASFALVLLGACALNGNKMTWPESQLRTLPDMRAEDQPCEVEPLARAETERETPLAPASFTGLRWPVFARAVTSHFGIRQDPIKPTAVRFHRGIDLSSGPGSLVYAALPGRVLNEGWAGGHGFQVLLDHGGGLRTAYSHLALPLVSRGMDVQDGQPLGVIGDTGRTTGPHLHFEVSMGGEQIDPYPLLGGRLPTEVELATPSPPRIYGATSSAVAPRTVSVR